MGEGNYVNNRVDAFFHLKHFQMLARKGRCFSRFCAIGIALPFLLFSQGRVDETVTDFLQEEASPIPLADLTYH